MTPHFDAKELACRCGCGMLPEQDFMDKVEILRVRLGFPMPVGSAARCPEYNAEVSATGRSGPHVEGRAMDIAISGSRALELVRMALASGFTGLGVNQKGNARFIHLDDLPNKDGQPRPHIWSYP